MRIHNLYTDANGESHFRDIEVEWAEERRGSKLSRKLPATGVIFRETQAEHNVDWHPAPRRQYIVNLDAGVKITASDGESRFIADLEDRFAINDLFVRYTTALDRGDVETIVDCFTPDGSLDSPAVGRHA